MIRFEEHRRDQSSMSVSKELADREAELNALQTNFDEYIESSRQLEEELDNEVCQLQKQLAESKQINHNLTTQLENLNPQLASLEKALAKSNALYQQESEARRCAEMDQDEAEAKARACEGTIDALKEESDKAFQELAFKEDEMDELKVMLEVEKEKHQEEMNSLRKELDDMRHNINVENHYDPKENSDNQKDDYIHSLEDELELVTEELIESNDQNALIMAELNELKEKGFVHNNGTEGLENIENSDMSPDVTEGELNNDKITQLQKDVETLTEGATMLKRELELSQEELLLTQQELEAAELDLNEATTKMEAEVAEQKVQLSTLQSQLDNANVEMKSAKLEVDAITESLLDSNRKNAAFTEQLEALNTALAHKSADNETLQEENVFLKKQFDEAQVKAEDKEKDVIELRSRLESIEQDKESLKQTLAKKELSILSLEEMEKNATKDDENMRRTLDETNLKLKNTMVELEATKKEVFDLTTKLEEKELKSSSLRHIPNLVTTTLESDQNLSSNPESELQKEENLKIKKHLKNVEEQYHISTIRIKHLEEKVHQLESNLRSQLDSNEEKSQIPNVVALEPTKLLPDDLDRIENEKNRLQQIFDQRNFDSLVVEVKTLTKKSEAQREHNAQLLTKILRLQGNIQVCCRVRPIKESELAAGYKVGVEALSETEVGCFDNRTKSWKSYAFDKVWGPNDGQMQVYQDVEPLALSVVDGYNSCIFAYGQTGSGKTFTMEGTSDNHQYGVSYRIIQKLFNLLESRKRKHASYRSKDDSSESEFTFKIEVGMLEIYNEDVFDLLTTTSSAERRKSSGARKPSLDIRQGANNTVEVPGLTKEKINSIQDVMDLLKRGNANRATASTNLNEDSSRSHMILTVRVVSGVPQETQSIGNLFLVDLAGSERIRKSGVEGKEMKEAQHINKSLSALGNVMEALDRKASHIPYRNSKLTFLLQDALSGNSKTMMIVAVCPASNSYDETSTALQFATRARRIHLGVAQKNIKSKNLEETVKSLTAEMKVLAKAKEQKEEQLIELRKSHERIQERLKQSQASRNKVAEQESRSMAVLRKNHMEMVSRYQHEKTAKEAKIIALEQNQQQVRLFWLTHFFFIMDVN